jgi:hypothetical protein
VFKGFEQGTCVLLPPPPPKKKLSGLHFCSWFNSTTVRNDNSLLCTAISCLKRFPYYIDFVGSLATKFRKLFRSYANLFFLKSKG